MRNILSDIIQLNFSLQVGFIDDCHYRTIFHPFDQFFILIGQMVGRVEHCQNQIAAVQALFCQLDTGSFYNIIGITNTGCICQIQDNFAQLNGFLHHVASGTRNLGNDGFLCAGQQIHQCRFTDIRTSDNNRLYAFAEDFTGIIISQDLFQRILHFRQRTGQVFIGYFLDILVRVVCPCGQTCGNTQQLISNTMNLAVNSTLSRAESSLGTMASLCRDQIHDRLSLCKAHLSVEESTFSKFTRFSRTSSCVNAGTESTFYQVHTAVTAQLHHIFTGVAVRRTIYKRHTLVNFAVFVVDFTVSAGITLKIDQLPSGDGAEHLICQLHSLFTGNADHTNAARSHRCRDRRDRLIIIHVPFLLLL